MTNTTTPIPQDGLLWQGQDGQARLKRYMALSHAMQSGVKYLLQHEAASGGPKHLRVGVNMALTENAALTTLLLEKGLLTARELEERILLFLEKEVESYQARLSELTGGTVTLA